jgi:hypothetical protein
MTIHHLTTGVLAVLKTLGGADAGEVVASRLAKLEEVRDRLRKVNSLARKRNDQKIGALRRLARMLDETGQRDVSIEADEYAYNEDVAAQVIRFQFRNKPDKATRALLRRAGFVLKTLRIAYERHLDEAGIAAASVLREHLDRTTH